VSYKNQFVTYKGPTHAYVDKVLLSSNDTDKALVKLLMRSTRRPGTVITHPPTRARSVYADPSQGA